MNKQPLHDYDDLIDALERGEVDITKVRTYPFLRYDSSESIISITPDPNECFNWELNIDNLLDTFKPVKPVDKSLLNVCKLIPNSEHRLETILTIA
jgi:hypothetical protein